LRNKINRIYPENMHLLSETATWKTQSEFVTPEGEINQGIGETRITIMDEIILNDSWVEQGDSKIENNYKIRKVSPNEYDFESSNPDLGIQKGKFNIERNVVYSKFRIEGTGLNGFEVIERNDNICQAYGALYDKEKLVNSWKAVMKKKEG
jgi:hypothetical protein